MKLGDSKCRLCIPAIDVTNGKTVVFKTRHHEDYINDFTVPAWNVAMSTSSAPVYFPIFTGNNGIGFIDGGLWANNPVVVGIAEAIKLGCPLHAIKVLSIGTGGHVNYKSSAKGQWAGLLKWRFGIIEWTYQMQSVGYHNIASYLCKDNYIRIDKKLPADKRGFFKRFKLDEHRDVDDLIAFSRDVGKETFRRVSTIFLTETTTPFVPLT